MQIAHPCLVVYHFPLPYCMSLQNFLDFQRKQNGILPPSSACQFMACSRATLYRLIKDKRVSVVRHKSKTYVGYNSALEWRALMRTVNEWRARET